jgi:hypothetical protein
MVESRPEVPAQPAEARYPVTALQLFPRLTRSEYFERFGEQAPAWDRSRRIQRWFDTSVLEEGGGDPRDRIVSYEVFDGRTGRFERLQMTAAEASMPNLPGSLVYPKYRVAPTRAVLRSTLDGSESPLNPAYLCEEAEALAVARELGVGPEGVRQSEFGGPWRFSWNGESRRLWTVEWKGERLQASMLVAQRNGAGVGAPGRWETGGAEPVWAPEVITETGEQDPRPEAPIPVRRLLPGERVEQTFGGIWVVVREDLEPPSNEERLERIDRRTALLAEHFRLAA